MKKYIIIALAAVVAFTACTKTNPEEKKAEQISFQVANYVPATKANVSILPEVGDAGFNTMAYLRAAGSLNTYQEYFGENGENVKWDATKAEWAPVGGPYYWPKAEESVINFFSWFSNNGAPAVVNEANAASMTWTNKKVAETDNIMYADPAWHFKKNIKPATYGSTLGNAAGAATEGVPTLFHHALSQIALKAYLAKPADDEDTQWEVKISKAYFTKYFTTGTLALTATEPALTVTNTAQAWDASSAAWTIAATAAKDGSYGKEAAVAISAETKADADEVLKAGSVLPQSISGNTDAQLAFDLYIKTTYKNGASNEETVPVILALKDFTDVATWAMNTRYTYIIKVLLGENKIVFDPAVVEYLITDVEAEIAVNND